MGEAYPFLHTVEGGQAHSRFYGEECGPLNKVYAPFDGPIAGKNRRSKYINKRIVEFV